MVKYVVFDFDGTLVDSKDVFISAWNKLADKNSFKQIRSEDLEKIKKLSIKERGRMLDFPMYKMPVFISQFYKLYKESLQDVHLFDGIKEMLHGLEDKGYQMAIISSNSREIIQQFLERNDMTTISDVLCSNRIFGKDQLLKRFMKDKGLEADDIIYVGDEERDILACKKTGIPIIWVSWGYDAFEAIEATNPEYKVYSPEEILEVI